MSNQNWEEFRRVLAVQETCRRDILNLLEDKWEIELSANPGNNVSECLSSYILKYPITNSSELSIQIGVTKNTIASGGKLITNQEFVFYINIMVTYPYARGITTAEIVKKITSTLQYIGYEVEKNRIEKQDLWKGNKSNVVDEMDVLLHIHAIPNIDAVSVIEFVQFANWMGYFLTAISYIPLNNLSGSRYEDFPKYKNIERD